LWEAHQPQAATTASGHGAPPPCGFEESEREGGERGNGRGRLTRKYSECGEFTGNGTLWKSKGARERERERGKQKETDSQTEKETDRERGRERELYRIYPFSSLFS
jgi:hypothetical protein